MWWSHEWLWSAAAVSLSRNSVTASELCQSKSTAQMSYNQISSMCFSSSCQLLFLKAAACCQLSAVSACISLDYHVLAVFLLAASCCEADEKCSDTFCFFFDTFFLMWQNHSISSDTLSDETLLECMIDDWLTLTVLLSAFRVNVNWWTDSSSMLISSMFSAVQNHSRCFEHWSWYCDSDNVWEKCWCWNAVESDSEENC